MMIVNKNIQMIHYDILGDETGKTPDAAHVVQIDRH